MKNMIRCLKNGVKLTFDNGRVVRVYFGWVTGAAVIIEDGRPNTEIASADLLVSTLDKIATEGQKRYAVVVRKSQSLVQVGNPRWFDDKGEADKAADLFNEVSDNRAYKGTQQIERATVIDTHAKAPI